MTKNAKIIIGVTVTVFALGLFSQAKKLRSMISRLGAKFENLHPRVQIAAINVIDRLAQQGISVGIPGTGGWRSLADQRGISSSATKVRNPLDGYHVWGLAVDFVPLNAAGGFYYPDAKDPIWQKIGNAIKAEGGEWGGDWNSFFDGPHGEWKLYTTSYLKAHYSDPVAFLANERSKGRFV